MLTTIEISGKLFYEKNPDLRELMFEDGKGHKAFGTYRPKTRTWTLIYGDKQIFDEMEEFSNLIKKEVTKKH